MGGRVSPTTQVVAIFPFKGYCFVLLLRYHYGVKLTSAANV